MRTTGVAPSNDRDNQPGLKSCNCKKSNCLKLYCDCFASSSYCSPLRCNCTACFNNLESENSRRIAVISTIERNPNAFRSKILSSSNPASSSQNQSTAEVALHHKGCHCKKSNCLKKYCECFQLGIVCSDRCRCTNCKNFPGSVERNKLLTVGIKEISQIIRKSESSSGVSEPSATSSSASSSSSGSGIGLPNAPPDVALVRRLDGLGSMITYDVISKVCQSMLQTAYLELEENSIAVGRKRDLPLEDFDQVTKSKKTKVDQSENPAAREGADFLSVEGDDTVQPSNDGSDQAHFAGHQSKMIVTKLLHAFGSSLLGAVRSSPSHSEVDMRLGIAGLHSMRNDRVRLVHDTSTISNDLNGHAKPPEIALSEVEQDEKAIKSHPSSVSYSELEQVVSKTGVVAATSPSMRSSTETKSTYIVASENKQLIHSSRSMSVSSSTTTEEQCSQERTDERTGDLSDSSRDDKDTTDALSDSLPLSAVTGSSLTHHDVAAHKHEILKSSTRPVPDMSILSKKNGAENECLIAKIRHDADGVELVPMVHRSKEHCSSNIDERSSPRHFKPNTTAVEQIAATVPENLITTAIHD